MPSGPPPRPFLFHTFDSLGTRNIGPRWFKALDYETSPIMVTFWIELGRIILFFAALHIYTVSPLPLDYNAPLLRLYSLLKRRLKPPLPSYSKKAISHIMSCRFTWGFSPLYEPIIFPHTKSGASLQIEPVKVLYLLKSGVPSFSKATTFLERPLCKGGFPKNKRRINRLGLS